MPLKVPSALCCMNETVKYRRGGVFLEREKRREREWNENQLADCCTGGRKRRCHSGGKPPEAGRAFPDKEPSGRDRAGFRA